MLADTTMKPLNPRRAPGRMIVIPCLAILLSCLQARAVQEHVVDTTQSGFDANDGLTTLDEAVAAQSRMKASNRQLRK